MSAGAAPEATPAAEPAAVDPTNPIAVADSHAIPEAPVAPTPGWKSSLPVDLRDNESLATFADDGSGLQEFTTRSIEAQKLIGRKGIIQPNWTDEADVTRFYNESGRPETVEGYDLTKVEVPENVQVGGEVQDSLLALLHKNGVSQHQMAGIMGGYLTMQGAASASQAEVGAQVRDESVTALKAQWGGAYDAKVDVANRALTLAIAKMPNRQEILEMKMADGGTFANNATVIQIFEQLGAKMSEGSLLGDKNSAIQPLTPETAKQELASFQHKNQEAIYDKNHPEHAMAIQRMDAYQRAIHPEPEEGAA